MAREQLLGGPLLCLQPLSLELLLLLLASSDDFLDLSLCVANSSTSVGDTLVPTLLS